MDILSFILGLNKGVRSKELEINERLDAINGETIGGKTVTFIDYDGTVLTEILVTPGHNCYDPVAVGIIPAPTKPSTVAEVFSFSGWSLKEGGEASTWALSNIQDDTTVYAAFKSSVRYYTVRFFNGSELLHSEQVAYNGLSTYTYQIIGSRFIGWNPKPISVASDMDCYGEWEEASFSADSWAQILSGSIGSNKLYSIGDEKALTLTFADGTTETIPVEIAALDVVTAEDANGYITIIAKTPISTSLMEYYHPDDVSDSIVSTHEVTFAVSDVLTYLNDVVFPALPTDLQDLIVPAWKFYGKWPYNYDTPTGDFGYFKLWIPSLREVCGENIYDGEFDTKYSIYANPSDPTSYGSEANTARVKTLYGSDEPVRWWLRTPIDPDGSTDVRMVETDGSIIGGAISFHENLCDKAYVVFGFCLGR